MKKLTRTKRKPNLRVDELNKKLERIEEESNYSKNKMKALDDLVAMTILE